MNCERCGEYVVLAGIGQRPRFCSTRCRVAAHRASKRSNFPKQMTARESWVRADDKRPIQPNGRAASSTDMRTWHSFAAVQSGAGDGFGIMLGDGLGCYDLDHVTDVQARDFIASIPEPVAFAERSVSGDGVHVFVEAYGGAGWKRTVNGISVERYTKDRFIRVTGNTFTL
jgi:primase-polymerase (primpol)-like protein